MKTRTIHSRKKRCAKKKKKKKKQFLSFVSCVLFFFFGKPFEVYEIDYEIRVHIFSNRFLLWLTGINSSVGRPVLHIFFSSVHLSSKFSHRTLTRKWKTVFLSAFQRSQRPAALPRPFHFIPLPINSRAKPITHTDTHPKVEYNVFLNAFQRYQRPCPFHFILLIDSTHVLNP